MPTVLKSAAIAIYLGAVCSSLSSFASADSTTDEPSTPRSGPPNIVLIVADDFGYENVTANGGQSYNTPAIDAIAARGMRFTNAFAQPLCTPSRVKLMTGQYNIRNYTKFGELDRSQFTFGNLLKSAGYATAVAGKWQLGKEADAPGHFGFDESLLWQHTAEGRFKESGTSGVDAGIDSRYPNPELQLNGKKVAYTGGEYGPRLCADFILNFIEKNRDRPFFVYYPMVLTHTPFDPTPDSVSWNPSRAGSTTIRGDFGDPQQNFADMVEYADKLVGEIDAKLEALGIRENTLLIFTGDNGNDPQITSTWKGISVRGGKRQLGDSGTRVPLVASWPGAISAGAVSDDLVDFADFLPTLAQLITVDSPPDTPADGVSFLPVLLAQEGREKDYVYIWSPGKGTMVRDRKYRLVFDHKLLDYSFYDDTLPFQPVLLDPTALDAESTVAMQGMLMYMEQIAADANVLPRALLQYWWSLKIHFTELWDEGVKLVKRRF